MPVMVNVLVLGGVLGLVVTVIVEAVVGEGGLKLAVAPRGNALAVKVTAPTNPFKGTIVMVYDVLLPRLTVRDAGVAEIEKSGVGAGGPALTALFTFKRPPVSVFPLRLGSGSTLFRITCFNCATESSCAARTSAADPLT